MTTVSPRTIAQVREWTDFPALVAEYITLRKSGAQWLGLCPHHDDRTPSFRVYESHGYCFACQWHCDCFSFLRHLETLDFPEALRRLADRAGIPLTQEKPISRAALRYAREEADMCRWWWDKERAEVMDLGRWELHNEEADQEWLACLFRMRQWIDAQGYSDRYRIFKERCTEREREAYREMVRDREAFAGWWMGLAVLSPGAVK